ncbi:MAG: diaminopimelate epimerase [Planctomycetota bacterium]|jgi:diaminopimelate epimerase|nr:diaminopimelate epimerase [Planctomycetota bacterium]
MEIAFDKMEGAGNDFVVIDNRDGRFPTPGKVDFVRDCCRSRLGIGADGVIFLEPDREFDFAWDFYNRDGSRAEMCGNGARCVAKFANRVGAAGDSMTFRTLAGPISATLTDIGAKVGLLPADLPATSTRVEIPGETIELWSLNTGVPHVVVKVADLEAVDVATVGRALRYHPAFQPAGTNANFFDITPDGKVRIRTYERGVENETLACGTGSVATSLVAGRFFALPSPVTVITRGGDELRVYFQINASGRADPVYLEGGARRVFSGMVEIP